MNVQNLKSLIIPIVPKALLSAYRGYSLARMQRRTRAMALPSGQVCFLRQVLQHLSNEQIRKILPKLRQFLWVFVTAHQPSAGFLRTANVDKPHGGDIRVVQQSGVYLEHVPFNVPRGAGAGVEADPGVIRTFVLRH